MSVEGSPQAWFAEMGPTRRGVPPAQDDLIELQISTALLESWECVAVLLTLLHEAGFQFNNLAPTWSQLTASKVATEAVGSLVDDVQILLAMEPIDWRSLAATATLTILPSLEAEVKHERTPIVGNEAEDEDKGLLMTDYKTDILGRDYVLSLRLIGLRPSRSPSGSSMVRCGAILPAAARPAGPALRELTQSWSRAREYLAAFELTLYRRHWRLAHWSKLAPAQSPIPRKNMVLNSMSAKQFLSCRSRCVPRAGPSRHGALCCGASPARHALHKTIPQCTRMPGICRGDDVDVLLANRQHPLLGHHISLEQNTHVFVFAYILFTRMT
ncbi:hypothetical protein F442_16747 [Phytophthora nicotianae P10297]|uniref:Uncharacterized protein n=1 Tax=Phytophthora nicotianae P10297 TaxID=1317064 RepID=W2YJA6_PHYNI|nr:hypothetical protein F442_16747 [Phytophthora nicotianae P10297]